MGDVPIARLPEQITLSLAEVAIVLYAVDVAVDLADSGTADARQARAAQRLLTARLWPELGGMVGDGNEESD